MRGLHVRRAVVPAAPPPLYRARLRSLDAVCQTPRSQARGRVQAWRALRLCRGHDSSRLESKLVFHLLGLKLYTAALNILLTDLQLTKVIIVA